MQQPGMAPRQPIADPILVTDVVNSYFKEDEAQG